MRIVGNRICNICAELNSNTRKTCVRCKNNLDYKNTIVECKASCIIDAEMPTHRPAGYKFMCSSKEC